MNKQEILNKYENEDDRLLVSKLIDKIEFTQKKNTVENTSFLDMHQRNILEKLLKTLKNYDVKFISEIPYTLEKHFKKVLLEKKESK